MGVSQVSTLSQGLEAGARVLRMVVSNLENNILKARKESADKKTLSIVARLVKLLEKITHLLDDLNKKVQRQDRDFIVLSQYTYIFKYQNGVMLIRSRPEHVILAYDHDSNTVSLKSRGLTFTISPSALLVNIRGRSITIDPISEDQFAIKREELRTALNMIEKITYRRLVPYLEHKVVRG